MPRGDPVHGIGIVRYPDAVSGQLVPKSYRSRAGDRRRRFQLRNPLGQLLGASDERLPDPLARGRVERGEDLAAKTVEDRQPLPLRAQLGGDTGGERVEGADAGGRQPGRGGEAVRGRDPDPQAGEGAGAEADRDQLDARPAAGGRGGALDLDQQRGRVPGPPGRGEPKLGLVQRLAVAPGAGGGIDGRGVEADDDQLGSAPPEPSP